MTPVIAAERKLSHGAKARQLRLSLHLTTRKLASMAGVAQGDVKLLENDLPMCLDTRRKLLKVLWAEKDASNNGERPR